MRIWSLHPSLLDQKGLVACWRETLLAQKVLQGRTSGYRNHPQLERFRAHPDPLAAIGAYLSGVADEADARGYRFNRDLIVCPPQQTSGPDDGPAPIAVTTGQLDLEFRHLLAKLEVRDPDRHARLRKAPAGATSSGMPGPAGTLCAHPLFTVAPGPVESWERADG